MVKTLIEGDLKVGKSVSIVATPSAKPHAAKFTRGRGWGPSRAVYKQQRT